MLERAFMIFRETVLFIHIYCYVAACQIILLVYQKYLHFEWDIHKFISEEYTALF